MRINLVTGGSGFVGKHLVSALCAKGEAVRVFDLAPPESLKEHSLENYVQGSITDEAALIAACEGVSDVFHLAGNAQLWAADESVFDAVNHQGTVQMLAAARAVGVERFVHCSSLTTLVGQTTPIGESDADETVRLTPEEMLGPYPRSKLLAERAVEAAAQEGFHTVIAVPTEPLGAGDDALTPPTQMMLDFLNGETPAYIDCTLNFTPTDSLALGLIAARDKGAAGQRYLLGGDNIQMAQLLEALAALSGRSMPKTRLPYGVALAAGVIDTKFVARLSGKPPKAPLTGVRLAGRRVSFSSAKAKRDLGWEAGSFEDALRQTYNWFDAQGLLKF